MSDIIIEEESMLLKELDYKLSFALECAVSINWEITPDFKEIVFSDNFETLYGIRQEDYEYQFEQLVEKHIKPHKEQIYEAIERYMKGMADVICVEISMYDDKGNLHWLHVRGRFLNEKQDLIYGVSVNITERKELEQRLAQLAYMDSQNRACENNALPVTASPSVSKRFHNILSYIHANYKGKITVAGIAKKLNISRSECFRTFKRIMNKSIVQYINDYRLEKAAALILTTEKSIIEISAECGFENVSYFGKKFKNVYGATPSDYKKTQVRTDIFCEEINSYNYEHWKTKGNGTMIITGNAGNGSFSCKWSDIDNVIFRSGKKLGYLNKTPEEIGDITLGYKADFNPHGDAYLSIYGWMYKPLIEFLIVENYSTYKPPGYGTLLGTFDTDGGTYEIIHTIKKSCPSIIGDNDEFEQFWSVRCWSQRRTSGTVSVSEHFKIWESFGLKPGKLDEVSLAVEGWLSSGSVIVHENVIQI